MQLFSPKKSKTSSVNSVSSKKFPWKKICLVLGTFFGIGIFSVIGIFAWFWKDLPSPGGLNNRLVVESTKIYDRSGTHLLYEVHGEEKRTRIPYSEMPETLRYATIALEDQNFYNHGGIEIRGIIRAALSDILHRGTRQGGSTITQQLVKRSMLTSEKTITRKIKEAILAIELEQKFDKDEILAMYLNEIPYGSNAYGAEAAAQTYFGKHAKDLDLAESALLASLPQAPTFYSPYGSHPESLKGRQEYALKQMTSLGYITEDQANAAIAEDILGKIKPYEENIEAPHFVMYVKEYLEKAYGEEAVEQGGLKVYTTLDWDKQIAAEQAVRSGAANNVKYKASNAALVAMDPKTGQILAMVGSKDYFDKSIDGQVNVAIRDRQPGSSFKPYVYLTAFKKGYTPETNLWDVDTNFSTQDGKTYDPKNYDGKNRGLLQMKNALAMSLNVPAVETLYLAGVKDSIATAKSMGITTLNNPDNYGLSLVLGGGEVKLLDHVNAFSTFATGGVHHNKTAILKIEDSNGKTLEQFTPNAGERVIDEKYVSMIDYILSTNDLRAPVFGTNNPLNFNSRPVAAKTGTTNEWRDGWTMGYTPSLAVGVWAGNNDNSIMAKGADGIYVAAPIFRSFMDESLKNSPIEQFPKYEKIETGNPALDGNLGTDKELKVCKLKKNKYCLANDGDCPDGDKPDKKKFSDSHSILYYVDKNNPRGDQPKNPQSDPQFDNWEKAVSNYLDTAEDTTARAAPTEDCSGKSNDSGITVKIKSPNEDDVITSSSLNISVSIKSDKDIKKASLFIDGSQVYTDDGSFNFTYGIPDTKKNTSIFIRVTAEDKGGDDDSDSVTITTNIP